MKSTSLDSYLPEPEEITINKAKFVITANVPRSIFQKYKDFGTTPITNETMDKYLDQMHDYLIDILSLENDPEYVKKEIEKLSSPQQVIVCNFYIHYLTNVYREIKRPDNEKKKN